MNKIVLLVVSVVGVCLFSCETDSDLANGDAMNADFDYQFNGDCSTPVLEVLLENRVSNADAYLSDFGDGTTSNQVNPTKIYSKSGNYTITLTAYFETNTIQTEKQISIIRNSDGTGPLGQLSFTQPNKNSLELTFEITTEAPTYSLDFGDSSPRFFANEKMIKHQYSGPGKYTALLIVENSEGCNCALTSINLTR